MNPNGRVARSVIGAFADGGRLMMMVMVTVLGWVILDVEPQVGFIHFTASGYFVGELEVHRLHSLWFGPFQSLFDVRHWMKQSSIVSIRVVIYGTTPPTSWLSQVLIGLIKYVDFRSYINWQEDIKVCMTVVDRWDDQLSDQWRKVGSIAIATTDEIDELGN